MCVCGINDYLTNRLVLRKLFILSMNKLFWWWNNKIMIRQWAIKLRCKKNEKSIRKRKCGERPHLLNVKQTWRHLTIMWHRRSYWIFMVHAVKLWMCAQAATLNGANKSTRTLTHCKNIYILMQQRKKWAEKLLCWRCTLCPRAKMHVILLKQ